MRAKERDRLKVLPEVQRGQLTQRGAGEQLGVTDRWVRKLLVRMKQEGDRGVVHRLRGRVSNRRLPDRVRARVLKLVKAKYHDFGLTPACSCGYQPKPGGEEGVREALRELAGERPRFGYRRLWDMLRRRKRKRVTTPRLPLMLPTRAQEMWTMDFTHDALVSGRRFRTLNLMDGYTRRALAIEVDTSLPGLRVVRVLEQMRQKHGAPERIQVDNGPEFVSQVVDQWAY